MKEPKKLEINGKDSWEKSLSASHLDDEGKCHIMVMSWGELSSISLNKTQVKRLVKWLNRWIEFKEDAFGRKDDE